MGRKKDIISSIIDLEWKMFQNVKNTGGKASCQEDYHTFRINRLSQAQSWSDPALESYLNDLKKAEKDGRNLLSEKYARMMASTSPSEYKQIAHLLPPLDSEALSFADKIVAIAMEWEEALADKYPHIVKRGRPIHSSQDTLFVTSVETYLRGELLTYSKKTLELVYENYLIQHSKNINGSEIILEHLIKQYGYSSLEQANKVLMD
jgi:hypothetical protein